jgi:hypothetical protein
MTWFKSNKQDIRPATCYILYYNRPHENNDGSFYSYRSSFEAQEYATLEKAQEAAKEIAKYNKVYITRADAIYEYYNKIVEFQV